MLRLGNTCARHLRRVCVQQRVRVRHYTQATEGEAQHWSSQLIRPLPLTGVLAAGTLITYRHYHAHEPHPFLKRLFISIPFRISSRVWGFFARIELPLSMRAPIYRLYSHAFGCKLNEMELKLTEYPSMAAFFARKLKPTARTIGTTALTSPVDGKVLSVGRVDSAGGIAQVKGIRYSLRDFVGEGQVLDRLSAAAAKGHLYCCTIYLAPGDYHGFHTPAQMNVEWSRHFAGYLLPVAPIVAKIVDGLFAVNERVLIGGKWQHGLIVVAPVGASNVGSIDIEIDSSIKTNKAWPRREHTENMYNSPPGGLRLAKGERIGTFQMGSTVVLLVESPRPLLWLVIGGQTLKLGEELANVSTHMPPVTRKPQ
jgi:phosphatidylserine decarboxylase